MNDLMLAQAAGPSPFGPIIVMAMIFSFFYFLVLRPQQRKEKEKDNFRKNLKKNDEVVSTGGIYGRVIDLKGSIVMLEVAQNVRIRIDRRSIEGPVLPPRKEETKEADK